MPSGWSSSKIGNDVDYHLCSKETTLGKLPTKMKCKDLTHDLSFKFYVEKEEPLKSEKTK